MSSSDRASLEAEMKKHYRWYDSGTRMLSTLHHGILFSVPVLAALATVVLKSKWDVDDLPVILTTAATVLATIAVSQGFAKKWQTNRMSRSGIDLLQVEMTDPRVDLKTVRAKLMGIIRRHDEGVIAAENVGAIRSASKRKK